MATPKVKIRREDLPPGEVLCDHCTAKCCRYFAVNIFKPTTRQDWDYFRWFLLHDRAAVYRESGDYYLEVQTACQHLQPDNRCGIYHTRPQICRDYSTDDCEYEEVIYEQYFEVAEQVAEYMEAVFPEEGSLRSKKPELLPIL